jgi:hypothetical protein
MVLSCGFGGAPLNSKRYLMLAQLIEEIDWVNTWLCISFKDLSGNCYFITFVECIFCIQRNSGD